jgi:hypothetical protein
MCIRDSDHAKRADLAADIAAAGKLTDTDASQSQREAGNYRKGKVDLHGLTVAIENPKGSTRSGVSKSGKAWSIRMAHSYGYILGSEEKSNDGDHVDVFLGDHPESELVFVVNQIDPESGKFDEVKVMLGFVSEADATAGYLSNYDKNWQGLGEIRAMTLPDFKAWLDDVSTKKAHEEWVFKTAQNILQRSLLGQLANPNWSPRASIGKNLLNNLQQVRSRGREMIQHADFAESLRGTIDPEYAWQRTQDQLAGRDQPEISLLEREVFQ